MFGLIDSFEPDVVYAALYELQPPSPDTRPSSPKRIDTVTPVIGTPSASPLFSTQFVPTSGVPDDDFESDFELEPESSLHAVAPKTMMPMRLRSAMGRSTE